MNAPVMISVLCGGERGGWIYPGLADSLFAAMQDCQQHQRPVAMDLTFEIHPVAHARNTAVAKFLQSSCGWLVQVDNDQHPQFRILDLIKAAEDAGKYIVSAPTPRLSKKHGACWNATETGPDDYYRTLPEGWFQPFVAGAGFLAVRRAAFEKVPPPWFDTQAEDFVFCVKANEAGFKVWAHSGYVCSHMHTLDLLRLVQR